ncbi:MAG: hypothetical protein Q8R91_07500 [Candidatus Omnitrophota bacterium]|nr:hypothetical protein [Candidatus Omnitrophota bacterium]
MDSLRLQRKRRGFFAGSGPSAVAGQSTLEYILVLAAILAAVIVGANSLIKPAVTSTMEDSQSVIETSTDRLKTGLGLP